VSVDEQKKQAIEELKKAMEKGMTSAKALDDAAFDRIRNEAEFKELSAKLAAGKQPRKCEKQKLTAD
jgi:uncharacterized protein YoaH (UPF0181 family)